MQTFSVQNLKREEWLKLGILKLGEFIHEHKHFTSDADFGKENVIECYLKNSILRFRIPRLN